MSQRQYERLKLSYAYKQALGDAIDGRNTDGNNKLLQLASSVHADLMRENPSYSKLFYDAARLSNPLGAVIKDWVQVNASKPPDGGRLSQLWADFKVISRSLPHAADIIRGKVISHQLESMAIPLMRQRLE